MTEVFVEITQREKPLAPPWSEGMLVSHISKVDSIPLRNLLGTRDGGLTSDVPISSFGSFIPQPLSDFTSSI